MSKRKPEKVLQPDATRSKLDPEIETSPQQFRPPAVTAENRFYVAGKDSLLRHGLASMANSCGFQAILIFEKRDKFPSLLGLPEDAAEGSAYLQVSQRYKQFLPTTNADPDCTLVVPLESYLDLYSFFSTRWPLICSELVTSAEDVVQSSTWIPLSKNLSFAKSGRICYSCRLAGNLEFQSWCEAGTANCKQSVEVAVAHNGKRLVLPLDTVTQLFSHPEAYREIYQRYKEAPVSGSGQSHQ